MPSPPVPELDDLLHRAFSFYPPIIGIEHNEFLLKSGTWSEMLVENTKTREEIWIPRRFFGALSKVDDPVMIVGLMRELEYKSGAVWPYERKVLDMPAPPKPAGAAPAAGDIREPSALEQIMGPGGEGTESKIGKLIAVVFASVLVLTTLVYVVVKFTPQAKPTFSAKDQSYLELTRDDDPFAVARKLGPAAEEAWRPGEGELQYLRMSYPDRGFTVILMGTDRKSVRYIGTLNKDWQPLHYVEFARGATTASLLRGLKKF
ncbi:MAG: hypothetical protein IT161_07720 [Bryobacterales bacterium]|nr:hypothetical protein [Bryobacterales bacterium]